MEKKMKKGDLSINMIILFILGAMVLALCVWLLFKSSGPTGAFIDKQFLQSKVQECELELVRGEPKLCGIYPPQCNICLGATKSEFGTDDDLDGMPNICEKETSRNNPKLTECNFYYRHNLCCKVESPDKSPCPSEYASIRCTKERPKA